ncbi:hypothetical protein [Rheinheimera metallidurans]|uniref:hypothetical protein n=1 Tax=Rheinheimera metallidurans TaxID=2925781 RepID=UPI00300323CD
MRKIIYLVNLLFCLLPYGFVSAQQHELITIDLPAYKTDKALIVKRLAQFQTEGEVSKLINEPDIQVKLRAHVIFSKNYQLNQLKAKTDFERARLAVMALRYYGQFGQLDIIKPLGPRKGYLILSADPQVYTRQLLLVGDVEAQLAILLELL